MWWHIRQFFTCLLAGVTFIAGTIGCLVVIVLDLGMAVVIAIYGNIDYDEEGLEKALQDQCPALEIDISKGSFDYDPMLNYYQQHVVYCYKFTPDKEWECGCSNSSD